jgi:hypothetical protein
MKTSMQHRVETARALSDRQAERELCEALRVQSMTPAARWQWLQDEWGSLQDSAALLSFNAEPAQHAARSYATLIEKNQFDEDRELQQALKMSIHLGHSS